MRCYKLVNGQFVRHVLHDSPSGHGMGFGDVDGDGKIEIILAGGVLHQPGGGPLSGPWTLSSEFSLGSASVPILVHDVNGDGLSDLIVGNAHNYGLYWLEQARDASGRRAWIKHYIDDEIAQAHDLQLCDIDGDGTLELITGKRFRAHCGRDPGDNDDPGVYYYKMHGGRFTKHVIDHGAPEASAGAGIWFALSDLRGCGHMDIIAPGKTGLYLFTNLG